MCTPGESINLEFVILPVNLVVSIYGLCVGDDGLLNIAVQSVLPAILMHFGKLKGKLH